MNVIARRTLLQWQPLHADASDALEEWYRVAFSARWKSLLEVRETYAAADQVGSCLIFNIRGNHYRLICGVVYGNDKKQGTLFLKHFLTHAQYDQGGWKRDCNYGR